MKTKWLALTLLCVSVVPAIAQDAPQITLPAPQAAKLSTEERNRFVEIATHMSLKGFGSMIVDDAGAPNQSRYFAIVGDRQDNGTIKLKSMVISRKSDPSKAVLTVSFVIGTDGNVRDAQVFGADHPVGDPVVQELLREEISFWMNVSLP